MHSGECPGIALRRAVRKTASLISSIVIFGGLHATASHPTRAAASGHFEVDRASTEVRVRIAADRTDVAVTGMDLVIQGESGVLRFPSGFGARETSSGTAKPLASAPRLRSLRFRPARVEGRVMWEISDRFSRSPLQRISGSTLAISGSMIRADLKPVPGQLRLVAGRERVAPRISVVAVMEIETYLAGVLPREMPADWPIEALKAQAIASRTFALHRVRASERAGSQWHLENTVMDQVFGWEDTASVAAEKLAAVERAISETSGQVLRDRQGRPFEAYFHADCGGRTEDAATVWELGRASKTAIDSGCPLSPLARWTWSSSGEELGLRLRVALNLAPGSRVVALRAAERTASGRVHRVRLETDTGQTRVMAGPQLRALLGYDRLKSTSFEIETSKGGFRFVGRGHGHGVGLCQWGSQHLAKGGADFRHILKHYYPDATLVSVAELADSIHAAASGSRGQVF